MRGKPYLVKLIRDRLPEQLPWSTVSYKKIEDEKEAIEFLRRKLGEEICEYLLKPGINELADIQETISTLAVYDSKESPARAKLTLSRAVKKKREERGGFDKLMGMYITADEVES